SRYFIEDFYRAKYPKQYQDILWTLLDRSYLHENEYANIWEQFFKLQPGEIELNLYAFDSYQDSPYYWDGIFASYYVEGLNGLELRINGNKQVRDEFLSIQTMRVIYNARLSGFLKIPYFSSSLKSCIHSKIISNETHTQEI